MTEREHTSNLDPSEVCLSKYSCYKPALEVRNVTFELHPTTYLN